MTGERFEVGRAGGGAGGEGAPAYVLLHAGVADGAVVGGGVARARRAGGRVRPARVRRVAAGPRAFRHVDDLLAVLDAAGDGPVWLVGNSMGGALAIDAALAAPERFAGLVLIALASAASPAGRSRPRGRERGWEAAWNAAGEDDLEERLRLDAWLWLDGPEPEGRVGGAARELALDMNRRSCARRAGGGGRPASTRGRGSRRSRCRSPWPGATRDFAVRDRDLPRTVARRVIPGARARRLDSPAWRAPAVARAAPDAVAAAIQDQHVGPRRPSTATDGQSGSSLSTSIPAVGDQHRVLDLEAAARRVPGERLRLERRASEAGLAR